MIEKIEPDPPPTPKLLRNEQSAPSLEGRVGEESSHGSRRLTFPGRHGGVTWALVFALLVLFLEVVCMAAPGAFTRYSPLAANANQVLMPPTAAHWLGTDANGVDLLSRIIYGTRTDLLIALVCVVVAMVVGGALGAFAGYLTNYLSEGLMRIFDFLQSFPIFILALAFVSIRGQSKANVIIVLSLLFIPVIVRLVRAEALSTSEKAYVRVSRHLGVRPLAVVFSHVLPNSLRSAVIQMSVNAGLAVLLTADLGFIGAGVRPPTPEWGADAASGAQQLLIGKWWASLFPGIAIIVTVWALSYISVWLGARYIRGRSAFVARGRGAP